MEKKFSPFRFPVPLQQLHNPLFDSMDHIALVGIFQGQEVVRAEPEPLSNVIVNPAALYERCSKMLYGALCERRGIQFKQGCLLQLVCTHALVIDVYHAFDLSHPATTECFRLPNISEERFLSGDYVHLGDALRGYRAALQKRAIFTIPDQLEGLVASHIQKLCAGTVLHGQIDIPPGTKLSLEDLGRMLRQ